MEDIFSILLLMLICLIFLFLGNILYHSRLFPITDAAELRFLSYASFREKSISSIADFLLSVIVAARTDIFCVLLIAFSKLTKIPRTFTYCIFSYRSLLFGFCGSYIIAKINDFETFAQGFLIWLVFFTYHVTYFAVLICFGDETLRHKATGATVRSRLQYMLTVFTEVALVILLNSVCYFLISKI